MKADSVESIIEYLNKHGIQTRYDDISGVYNRVVELEVDGNTYYIEWWINQCYFKLKNEFSSPNMPFKYININRNSPTTKHNCQLCFYDEQQPGEKGMFYNEIPFGCMKIPFNLK